MMLQFEKMGKSCGGGSCAQDQGSIHSKLARVRLGYFDLRQWPYFPFVIIF